MPAKKKPKKRHGLGANLRRSLGRNVQHDPRSKEFALPKRLPPTKDIQWPTFGTVLQQGSTGSCTGHAAAHYLNTGEARAIMAQRKLPLRTNADAKNYYHLATALDQWPGVWPPDDTGSSGLAVMKALIKLGLAKQYRWAFGIQGVLGAITQGPMIVGTPWYDSMFAPDANGLVVPKGRVAGGHEYLLSGYQIVNKTAIGKNLFWFRNSWGISWGNRGGFCMTVASFESLLGQQGDAARIIL